jgi:hypothetical protein
MGWKNVGLLTSVDASGNPAPGCRWNEGREEPYDRARSVWRYEQDNSTRLQHAMEFGEDALRVSKMLDNHVRRHQIEGLVWERKSAGIRNGTSREIRILANVTGDEVTTNHPIRAVCQLRSRLP